MHLIPSELRSEACLGESSTRMGDLLGSPRVAPLFRCLFFCPFFRTPSGTRHPRPGSSSPAGRASGRRGSNTRRWAPQGLSGGGNSVSGHVLMIIACAYNGSTRMGDLLGSPRVAPLFRCLFFCPFTRPPSGARHPRPGSSSPAGRASGRRGSNTRIWAPQGLSGGGPSVRGRVLMIIACSYNGTCDHTSTNAPDPIRTPQ
ncbi:hypothetical protein PIB30_109889 [Stylosanthes scabra]|uniref:Uncharacterized protein n=1 Tax=Stylosanthes scabra TaxID=79078 RepID=A0ABU6U0J5_9FABA|nr:hypothetical protein [Stylosanthes scabra]